MFKYHCNLFPFDQQGLFFPIFDNWEEPILLFDAADREKNIVQFLDTLVTLGHIRK